MTKQLSAETERRILENKGLVYYFANRLCVPEWEYEDFIQEGMMGLIKAANSFDETQGIKFVTYASICIKNEMRMRFRDNNRHKENASLNMDIFCSKNGEKQGEEQLQDIIPDPLAEKLIEKSENIEIIEKAVSFILNCFSMRGKIILMLSIGGSNQENIAKFLNISQSYVSRMQKKAYERVRQCISKGKEFEEDFLVSIVEEKCRIVFFTTDVVNFNKAFANFLLKNSNSERLKDFKVTCTNGKVEIQLLAEPESFTLIAEIMKEIENYGVEIKRGGCIAKKL